MDRLPSSEANTKKETKRRCQFCGQIAELVWVHGHGQCSACGINAEECCRGEVKCEGVNVFKNNVNK